jgi:hypothetical protein
MQCTGRCESFNEVAGMYCIPARSGCEGTACNYTSVAPCVFLALCLNKHRDDFHILSRVGVNPMAYKMGFGLDDWIC